MPEEDVMRAHMRAIRRGSDPRAATCRGKLQTKRSKLNQEINKELMLRTGAENLYKATTNKKLKETVALELSFVNSNLQLLKEQLSELNSSVEVYQGNSSKQYVMPMIPLGLKETKEIDFSEAFKDFILEHYSEEAVQYEKSIREFMDIRQAMRTPKRDQTGVSLLFEYFNQLYYVERRFFPPERSLGIYFEWYDSLTGVPSCQRTMAFEKASVLFNIGALYTQIGAQQNRASSVGLDSAVDSYLRAAGTFKYIHENFTNAPSMDLCPEMLDMLMKLMLSQARECLFEKLLINMKTEKIDIDCSLEVGQEAAYVSDAYSDVHSAISIPPVKDYVPYSWISILLVKREYYRALAHYNVAVGLLDHVGELSVKTQESLQYLHQEDENKSTQIDIRVPSNAEERQMLGRAHLRESVLLHEESLRIHRMCRELRKRGVLQELLTRVHDRAFNRYSSTEEEDNFQEVLDPPAIIPSTKYQISLTTPDFSQYKVEDLFYELGPVSIFSAKHHWSAPRTVPLQKREGEGFGFSVRGDAPVIIAGVDPNSLADLCGMREGDFIVGISDTDVKWAPHEEVVDLIKAAEDTLTLRLVTPMDRSYLKPKGPSKGSISPNSTTSSSSGVSSAGGGSSRFQSPNGSLASSKSKDSHRRGLVWNPFKKKDRKEHEDSLYENNVILR